MNHQMYSPQNNHLFYAPFLFLQKKKTGQKEENVTSIKMEPDNVIYIPHCILRPFSQFANMNM